MTHILFGTESGNSEMAADDIASAMRQHGKSMQVVPMEDADVGGLSAHEFVVVVTSTYGDGELPETTQPFFDAMQSKRPNLSGLRFAAFGLGDSAYETYGNGIDKVTELMTLLGATQVGATGRHDAAKSEPLSDVAMRWASSLIPALPTDARVGVQ